MQRHKRVYARLRHAMALREALLQNRDPGFFERKQPGPRLAAHHAVKNGALRCVWGTQALSLHRERSEAIHLATRACGEMDRFVAALLAMTGVGPVITKL